MSKKPIILGIESSCDETAASIVSENEQGTPIILSNIVSSQVEVHKEFGGVVPELAARAHIDKIDLIVQKAIDDSGIKKEAIDAVASTAGPGLIVCLSVGLSFGKSFASAMNIPFISVPLPSSADNHQFKNADYYEKKNFAFLVEEKDLNEKLFYLIKDIYNNISILDKIRKNQNQFSDKNVYNNIDRVLKEIINGKN